MTYLVHIHNRRFAIADDDIRGFKQSVLDAVRRGGDFLPLGTHLPEPESILVTAFTPVTIEKLPLPDDEEGSGSGSEEYAFIDFDEGI